MKLFLNPRPRLPFVKDRWVIKKSNTYFGIHVPRLLQPTLTETWLFLFEDKRVATRFAVTLARLETGKVPVDRIFDCQCFNWKFETSVLPGIELEKQANLELYEITRVNFAKLLILASLEDFIIKRVILNGLGDFVTLPQNKTPQATSHQKAMHLNKLLHKQINSNKL